MRRYFSQTLFFFLCSTALALTVEEALKSNQAYTRGENTLLEARNKGVDEKEPLLDQPRRFERALANFNSCLGQAESSALHFNMGHLL